MSQYILSPAAEQDLDEIVAYIAIYNPRAAVRIFDEIVAAFTLLAEHPGAGRHRDEIALHVRSFPVGSYLVFYQESESQTEIVRVLHGRRDLPIAFFDTPYH